MTVIPLCLCLYRSLSEIRALSAAQQDDASKQFAQLMSVLSDRSDDIRVAAAAPPASADIPVQADEALLASMRLKAEADARRAELETQRAEEAFKTEAMKAKLEVLLLRRACLDKGIAEADIDAALAK